MRYFAFIFILSLQNPACMLNIILQTSHISSTQQSQVAPLVLDSTALVLATSLRVTPHTGRKGWNWVQGMGLLVILRIKHRYKCRAQKDMHFICGIKISQREYVFRVLQKNRASRIDRRLRDDKQCMHGRSVMSNSLWPMDCSPPGSPVHGIFQARILE